jgi:hypothetical protein
MYILESNNLNNSIFITTAAENLTLYRSGFLPHKVSKESTLQNTSGFMPGV